MHQPQNNQNDKSSIVAFRTFGRLAKGTKQAKYLLCLNIALHSLDLNWAHTNTGLKHSSRECGTCKHTNTQTEYKCTSTKQLKDYIESHRLKLAVTQQAVCCALCRKTSIERLISPLVFSAETIIYREYFKVVRPPVDLSKGPCLWASPTVSLPENRQSSLRSPPSSFSLQQYCNLLQGCHFL